MGRAINAAGLALVKTYEGLYLSEYQDIVGVMTIGWGHTVGVTAGESIDVAQAEAYLQSDLEHSGAAVLAALPGVALGDNEYAALTSLVFNVGPGALAGTNLAALLRSGDMPDAADGILLFDHAGGQVVQGLLNRRTAERALFLEPDSADPATGWDVSIGGASITAQLIDDEAYAPLRDLCKAVFGSLTGTDLAWNQATMTATWNGAPMLFACQQIGGVAWAPVRAFAAFIGCGVTVNGETVTVVR